MDKKTKKQMKARIKQAMKEWDFNNPIPRVKFHNFFLILPRLIERDIRRNKYKKRLKKLSGL
jgi:hypothetical protein